MPLSQTNRLPPRGRQLAARSHATANNSEINGGPYKSPGFGGQMPGNGSVERQPRQHSQAPNAHGPFSVSGITSL